MIKTTHYTVVTRQARTPNIITQIEASGGTLHLEQMSDGEWFLAIHQPASSRTFKIVQRDAYGHLGVIENQEEP